jgi:DNA-3-methyladenine glycosylase
VSSQAVAGPPVTLPREFFDRPVTEVAPDLLGCVLTHETDEGVVAAELTEVEAYAGELDPASHAYRGLTPRTEVMFGPPGHAYVYFTYGMHYCVNLVCGPPGVASAVLLRAGRIVAGEELALVRRGVVAGGAKIASGPARLCQALGIGRAENGADVCAATSRLRVAAGALRYDAVIQTGPRVGVSRGAEVPWRYWVAGEPSVSAYRPYVPRRTKSVTVPRGLDGTMHAWTRLSMSFRGAG